MEKQLNQIVDMLGEISASIDNKEFIDRDMELAIHNNFFVSVWEINQSLKQIVKIMESKQ